MDADALRAARRREFKADLADAYADEEACPPEWVDLLTEIPRDIARLREHASDATSAFASEPDIKIALARRERAAAVLRDAASVVNEKIRRLNLIAPHSRFTRGELDADALIRPLYRTPRSTSSSSGAVRARSRTPQPSRTTPLVRPRPARSR